MRIPSFAKTIRFKLTLWYTMLFLIFFILLIGGINLAMQQFRDINPIWQDGKPPWQEIDEQGVSGELVRLRIYSLICFGVVPVLGFVGGYFLAGRMLKPVSRVSSLAARISSANLKERINYHGPNDELKYLADTFDDMLGRLEAVFESQKQFIQDASHELRTPIAIAQTNIEVTEMAKEVTASDYKHLMKGLKQNLERMTQLADQLLLLADTGQEHVNWQVTDMKAAINEVASEVNTRIAAAGISLELELAPDEVMVRGDSLRIKQALSNLIDNAIRYNQPGGWVKVSTRLVESRLIVVIQDSGIGISPAEQPYIFDRFYRVDKSRARSQGGSGLGLAIVKKIVEDHGGTISVESALGKGSTFQIILPRHVSA
jgi:signal transduction histidine kinase